MVKEFKTWASVVLFSGLGMAVLLGAKLPKDPSCELPRRCYVDDLSQLQDTIGNGPLALGLFACAVFSFFWYQAR